MVDDLFDLAASGTAGDGRSRVVLRVHVQPGAGRTSVVGRHGDALKVRVAAPPEGGRANDACAALLAETFGVAPSSVTIASGASSRMKRFALDGLDLDGFRAQLERAVAGPPSAGRRGSGRP